MITGEYGTNCSAYTLTGTSNGVWTYHGVGGTPNGLPAAGTEGSTFATT